MTALPDGTDGGFAALGLEEKILDTLSALGYEEPTPIQREAIPPLLEGRDLLGQAATGTGKTAAFALPLLQRIALRAGRDEDDHDGVSALILVPTRELAIQVAEAVHRYGKTLGVRVLPVYGGQAISQQLRALNRGVDVVVATPGRALDHIGRGSMDLSTVRVVVLDEADEMLDMGFAEDLEAILEAVPTERQTALLSATMPSHIMGIAERHLREPVHVRVAQERVAPGEVPRVRQVAYVVQRQHKVAALGRVLDMESPSSAIVFCRTRTEVDELTEKLGGRGYRPEALHGGFSQEQRDRVMRRFRAGTADLLIATDVAARGLDIENVSHVINFDVPSAPEAYVHRIGRTGRAGREGVAVTLAEPREHRLLRNIERFAGQKITVEAVPTVLDLRARRLELTRAALREQLLAGELDNYRVVIDTLADEFDVVDIAMAAVKLAHESDKKAEDEEMDIPPVRSPTERPRREREGRWERAGRDREFRTREPREREPREHASGDSSERPPREGARRDREFPAPRGARRGAGRGRSDVDVTRLYIGVGRKAGVRPGDLVGAIANEAGIDARDIGGIDITDRFSIVEVPGEAAEEIVRALRATTIRGKRVTVRRDRESY